jgi:hypothetical protein
MNQTGVILDTTVNTDASGAWTYQMQNTLPVGVYQVSVTGGEYAQTTIMEVVEAGGVPVTSVVPVTQAATGGQGIAGVGSWMWIIGLVALIAAFSLMAGGKKKAKAKK